MKKILLVIFILCMVCGCDYEGGVDKQQEKKKEEEKQNTFDTSYIETVPRNATSFIELYGKKEEILTTEQIQAYNEKIKEKSDTIYDIEKIKSMSREQILSYINQYKMPNLPKYDGNTTITRAAASLILENQNIFSVKNKNSIEWGLVVSRTNLRSFPTNTHFYNKKGVEDFDNLQETELLVNTPLLILHESKDGVWDFVLTKTYAGWVQKENIAIADEASLKFFTENPSFGVVTDCEVEVDGVILDMSTRLPYIGVTEEGYQFSLPIKNEKGSLDRKTITLTRAQAHIGYLPYNTRNVYIQAFKYEGVNYSWSGMDRGEDCSGYISNVYRTFGLEFPRNTSSQNKSVGTIIDLQGKTNQQKLEMLSGKAPSLLYQEGHVMLYIGEKDGKHYVIHANGTDMKVAVTELNNQTGYLKNINKIVALDKSFLSNE